MKKTLWDLCLLATAGAAILCMFALLLAVFQVPNTVGINNSFLSQIATTSFNFVENQHNSVIWIGVVLLVVLPLGAKVLPRLHERILRSRSGVASAYSAQRGGSILSAKSNVLNPSFRRGGADDHVGSRTESPLRHRRVS